MRQNEETAWRSELLPKASWISRNLVQSCVWILSAGREELEVSSRPMSNASHTRTQDDTSILLHPLLSKLPWDVSKPQKWLWLSGVNWPTQRNWPGLPRPSAVAFLTAPRSGLGFPARGLRMTSLYQAFLPYSCDLPFGGNMYLGTSNILPSY